MKHCVSKVHAVGPMGTGVVGGGMMRDDGDDEGSVGYSGVFAQ